MKNGYFRLISLYLGNYTR